VSVRLGRYRQDDQQPHDPLLKQNVATQVYNILSNIYQQPTDIHHPNNMASQASSQKTRHYAMLASKLKQLQGDLAVTEECMGEMSKQLDSMAKLGAYCGSQ